DRLYLIARGEVECRYVGPTGLEELLAVLGEGDHFGEMARRRDLPRTTTIRTRQPSTFLTLERRWILRNMGGIVSLPDAERWIVSWALRHADVGLHEAATAVDMDAEGARKLLDSLVTKGYLQEFTENGETRYRARLALRRESRLSGDIWRAVGDA